MKKIKSILLCLLALTVSIGCFSGCQDGDSTAGDGDITMLDFEQWGPDFQLCRISLGFGKVSVNTDANYVKEGKQSCKIEPKGWDAVTADLTMYFPTVFYYD